MAGSLAHDDPGRMRYLRITNEHAPGDPDVHLLTNLDGVGDTAVNAIRRPPDVSVRRLVDLHRDPETRRLMVTAGRERVHERSLPPREVEDQLRAMSKLV